MTIGVHTKFLIKKCNQYSEYFILNKKLPSQIQHQFAAARPISHSHRKHVEWVPCTYRQHQADEWQPYESPKDK